MITATDSVDVLLIEDDEDDYVITRSLLAKARTIDAHLDWAKSYDQGLDAILSSTYDACLVDYRLGAKTGLDVLDALNERGGVQTPVILLTGQGDVEVDLHAMQAGASDYLSKEQIDAPLLERSIRYAIERTEAEQRIREQAQFLDKARDAIMAYDMDGRVVYWNKSAERLTGYSKNEIEGMKARDALFRRDEQEKLHTCYQTVVEEGEWTGELKLYTKDDEELIVESRWTLVRDAMDNPSSILIINTDITERKQLESQFLRSQRMESIGRLVGGIAHDLGNLLQPILLGVQVLRRRLREDSKSAQTLSMIEKSAERGSDMVEQVLTFARGVEGERAQLQPGMIIDEVESITDETFADAIKVVTDVSDDLNPIVGDATQIQQVLMNLCVNARDALEDGGTLAISAANAEITEDDAQRNIEAEPGTYVRIRVDDTGPGIPDDVIDKIFEPFFSTKEEGEGTGLGLSTAYSIVKSHDGFIDVESSDAGTRFDVYIPVADVDAPERTAPEERALTGGSGETVLIVDDEAFIRDAAQQTLTEAGYRVETADGAEAALRIADDRGDDIDAVITDLRMPSMDGFELIRRLHARRPDLPIIAASGMADGRTDDAVEAGARTFLAKPFTAEKLQGALQDVLQPAAEA